MQLVKQSTSRALPILMVDSTDGYTEETGLTLTITVRKAGSSTWSASAGTTTERGNGSYEYAPTTGEVDTLGVFEYRAASAGARTFRGAAQVVVELPGVVASIAADAITATAIAADAITAAKIADGAIDAATFAGGAINAAAIASDAITAAKVATGAITAAKFAAGAIDAAALASDAATEIAIAVAAPSAATITAAVVAGMAGAPVGSVTGAVGSVTAGVTLAANAVTAAAVASDAVAELQAGLATAAALTTVGSNVTTAIAGIAAVEVDTQDLQARLPAALVSGRIDASVGAMAAGVVTAAAVATGAIDADALAADAATEIATAVDAALSVTHGAGAWEGSGGATAADIADAVCDEALAGHATAGTLGAALTSLLSGVAALPSAATTAAAAASAVWAAVAEGSHTFSDYFRIAVAALVGRHTGTTGTNVMYSPVSTSTPRVTATVASDGTRGNPTIDGD